MHEDFAALATELISVNGSPAILHHWNTPATALQPRAGLMVTPVTVLRTKWAEEDTTLGLVKADAIVVIADNSATYEAGDELTLDGIQYAVYEVRRVKPGTNTVLNRIYLSI